MNIVSYTRPYAFPLLLPQNNQTCNLTSIVLYWSRAGLMPLERGR
nr:hypothetical protein Q903MT_gene651 [Picea sitchensis]